MNSPTVIKVVIVDDDALMPQLSARILASAQIEVVHVANDGDQVVEIVEAVRHVAAGEGALSPRAARVVIEQMRSSSDADLRRRCAQRLEHLSERDREVALAIANGKTNPEIARELFLAETTVKTHISAILEKINVGNRAQVASIVAGAGWITAL